MSPENWREIKTLGEFNEIKSRASGYVVITDKKDESTVHAASCAQVSEARFADKVVRNEAKFGGFFWTDDLDFAMYKWDAYKCGNCLR
ncbi:MAG: hypothetical protein ABR899_01940 [Candidatus Krumholzibacteriaceae bacterium]|jgi:hypothetical protein